MTKLCPRGKAAAKRKFKVYPSAYANAYASKICAGKAKDPSGLRRKDFKGPKPAGKKEGGLTVGSGSAEGRLQKIRKLKQEGSKIVKDIYSKPRARKKNERLPQTRNKMQPPKNLLYEKGPFRPFENKGKIEKGPFRPFENKGKYKKAMNAGGNVKIKKVISGLKKASKLHQGQAKSLETLVKKADGGYIGSHIKSDLAGEPVSNKSYEAYYKDLL